MMSFREKTVLAVLGVSLLLAIGLMTVTGYSQAGSRDLPATVIRFFGDVQIKTAQAEWTDINTRQRIHAGDSIRTGENSYVLVELSDRNIVKILSNAEFTFTSMTVTPEMQEDESVLFFFSARSDQQQFEMNLEEGGAVSVLRGLEGNSTYNLHTPVASAGVRGTIFLATYEEGRVSALDSFADGEKGQAGPLGTAGFWCYEGFLNITNPQGGFLGSVPSGQAMMVSGGGGSSTQGLGGTQLQILQGAADEFDSYGGGADGQRNPNIQEGVGSPSVEHYGGGGM